jgi:hypothetical protein
MPATQDQAPAAACVRVWWERALLTVAYEPMARAAKAQGHA